MGKLNRHSALEMATVLGGSLSACDTVDGGALNRESRQQEDHCRLPFANARTLASPMLRGHV